LVGRLAVVVLLGCLVGVAAGRTTAGAATPPLGPVTGMTAGWTVLWESDSERLAELNMIAATGAKWFGMDIDWNSIQPKRGVWNWGPTDRVVREARARGLNIIGTLAYSPRWAVPASCPLGTTHCLPARAEDFARFAVRAVQRYGMTSPLPGLHASILNWQVWNEPNHVPFVNPTVDPALYTQILKTTYLRVKAVDIWTRILAGGTAPAPNDPYGRDMGPVAFLNAIYANGGKGYFDAFAHHPYSFPCSPLYAAPWNAFGQTAEIYYSMVVHGDGAKKIWGTETGSPTGGDLGPCPSNAGVSVTEPVQALHLQQYLWGWNTLFKAFTGPLLFHQIRDAGTNPWLRDDNFGLLHRNLTPKPAYTVFTNMMKFGG
jgi:hypothetical protein